MGALDVGRDDIRESGAFLAKLHQESRRRVESFGGGHTFGPPIDWNTILTRRELENLDVVDLNAVNEEFELYWNIALGKTINADIVDAATGASTSIDLPRTYFVAFDQVLLKLKEAWRLNQYSKHNHLGWDLSPFGYVTKTIRDKEFFTAGDIPGDCILQAVLVDRMGRSQEVIPNQ